MQQDQPIVYGTSVMLPPTPEQLQQQRLDAIRTYVIPVGLGVLGGAVVDGEDGAVVGAILGLIGGGFLSSWLKDL